MIEKKGYSKEDGEIKDICRKANRMNVPFPLPFHFLLSASSTITDQPVLHSFQRTLFNPEFQNRKNKSQEGGFFLDDKGLKDELILLLWPTQYRGLKLGLVVRAGET